MNVGRFLGLSQLAAKSAISNSPQNAVYCAMARRQGATRCAAQISILGQGEEDAKYDGLEDPEDFLKEGEDGPAQKKMKTSDTAIMKTIQLKTVISKEVKKGRSKKIKKKKTKKTTTSSV